MKNRCIYCESTDKDVVCWECLEKRLRELREELRDDMYELAEKSNCKGGGD